MVAAPDKPLRVLILSHDGGMYGAQQSLAGLVAHLPRTISPVVSIARHPNGPFAEVMAALPHVTVVSHQRVQWVKHAQRHWWQRVGDCLGLLSQIVTRVPKLARLIRTHDIDLVHTNSVVSLEGALAAKLAGVPHIWHIREMFTVANPKFQPVVPIGLMRQIILALSTRIVAISGAVAQQFGDSGKLTVVGNPFKPAETSGHPTSPSRFHPEALRLGYVGRLSPGKGVLTLLQALALGRHTHPKWHLHLFGAFPDEAAERAIRAEIDRLGLAEALTLHGFTTDPAAIYGAMDVLILPSTNEALGRVLLEAMAYGVRCVGTNAGGIPEVLIPVFGPSSLFPPNDTTGIVSAIKAVAAQPFPQAAAQARLASLSPERIATIMAEVYHQTMAAHKQ